VTTSSDDAELVRQAARGCAKSAAALAARHQAAVVHYAARLLARRGGSRADAEDVAQESIVRALDRLDRLDESRAFVAWLFAIVRRRCLNHLRAARRRQAREAARAAPRESAPREDPRAVAEAREESERLWAIAARELPERQFSALWLRTVEELPVADIARVLGRPAATVKVMLFRGRRRLAEVLDPPHEAPTVPLPARAAVVPATRRSRHG
jgi:RNA polymerase sigma-70 factor (ECF subfamily)